ncbi:MAG: hypothetical protein LBR07_06245 [Puniceicoccales bacterium]|jgi:hypothetical protein|nr:hypothetical protein [Puniceicoccales bacterium]
MVSAYIILGAAGSGRREVLADLLENGTPAGDARATAGCVRLYLADDAFTTGDGTGGGGTGGVAFPKTVEIRRWSVAGGNVSLDAPESAPETVFLVTDGRANPVDQMEILAALLPRLGWEVARIITVVNCALLAANPALADWFKACVHFSDAALLARRESVPNAWVAKFVAGFKDECNPCLFEFVKGGRVANAPRVLVPEARRLSMIFDDTDGLDEMEFDENNLPDEPFDIKPGTDPWFERAPNGARRLPLPDIREFLERK